ncbi:macro domain-containing protein [Xiamenia xianingshaonis]|uniref:Macro domain-containing protein n=1 Tax=Xiamenia xianingshaonis TaxID=2682776 RepID=A0A9E6MQ53_9ACTN|nr:macro domain-containing protein [Xiamenia xianingshaonis]NHM14081.1 RNase III inhibitor [Xiamenia xianingshaonis]QTU83945.1 macro domain-containing protein [Xiamenia xianingshaonis]
MPLHIVRDDIANMRTDAVIVPANPKLLIGGGAGEAVARIAGRGRLQAACDEIGGCAVGKAVVTPAFDFPANMIVHAVGPVWKGGESGEADALFSCVSEALRAASRAGAETMALPLLATGSFGFPSGLAIDIETRAIQAFLDACEADVWLVFYDRASMRAGRSMFDAIAEYIDDVYVGEHGFEATRAFRDYASTEGFVPHVAQSSARPSSAPPPMMAPSPDFSAKPSRGGLFKRKRKRKGAPAPAPTLEPQSLAERLAQLDESFAQTVLRLIDERGLTDVEVYKRANMSRQLFAKIRKDDGYRPTKKTACALVFALGLDHADAVALLARAGFALSHSSKFDVIVEYFLVNDIHDIFQVNEALFAYDQPLLG